VSERYTFSEGETVHLTMGELDRVGRTMKIVLALDLKEMVKVYIRDEHLRWRDYDPWVFTCWLEENGYAEEVVEDSCYLGTVGHPSEQLIDPT